MCIVYSSSANNATTESFKLVLLLVVVFTNEFTVKKTTIYLVYDKPDENIFGRLFFAIPSLARTVLTSQPFWFCLAGVMVWSSCNRSEKTKKQPYSKVHTNLSFFASVEHLLVINITHILKKVLSPLVFF
ncbi:unnamed protein product [Trifolium pratense]|uniref:Uncharacterized protein n=1 Tax=Trifolium pratense TaxID=57577 RepID=A0ACB0KI14_TRIPR|nr:unnamed protein product [Trifolium pratense]